ncbi:MAG: hypothetical protein ABI977_04445 [Acidobacteriota bacterium]
MFCPQCGVQAEQQTKFCKSCGLKLADHVQLIAASREVETERMSPADAQRQLRWLKGTRALMFSIPLVPLLMMFIGIAASTHGPDADIAGGIAFVLSCLWLGINSRGLFHLLRSGFFKTYKEKRIRAEAALLAQPMPQPRESFSLPPETNRISPRLEPTSIAEPTTRELRQASNHSESVR